MLSDDVEGGLNTGFKMIGSVVRGAFRGALLGAVLTLGAAAIIAGGMAALAATGGVMATLTAAGGGAIAGIGAMFGMVPGAAIGGVTLGPALLIGAAKIGALVMGVGSIIPGISDMWSGAKKVASPAQDDVAPPVVAQGRGRTAQFEDPSYAYDTGHAARLQQQRSSSPNIYRQ